MENEITFGLNSNKEGLFYILQGQYVTLTSRSGSSYTGRIVSSKSPEHICLKPSVVARPEENKGYTQALSNLPLYVVLSSIEGVFVKSRKSF